ncbi:TPA: hypothetical protein H1012_02270 [archaeon]|nr:hypothetical protein [Candidatus Naiadarchaeales archaeon SRR2090159.bin1288]
MNNQLRIFYNLNDAIEGERIRCIAEKITEIGIGGISGRHRKQGITIQNGRCWITKTFRQGPIKL